jgi:predicted transcriptional regulator
MAMERIAEGEYAVMEVLWREAPLTAAEVAERVPADRGWSLATVKTMLSRLLAKGVLAHDEDGRRYLYRPAIDREDYVAEESGRLIDRMFAGRVTPLVAQLAARDRLSPADIEEIEALLKELKS